MSDARGLIEHALGPVPRREGGYCLDDNARALILLCRHRPSTPGTEWLAALYLRFVLGSQARNGACHNRLDAAGRWTDEPSTGDWWGRALWALGTAAARGTAPRLRAIAADRYDHSAALRSPDRHAMAFAALGAAEILTAQPHHRSSLELLADAAATIGRPAPDPAWPWPETRLRYANAALAEALIAAGAALRDDTVLADGLDLLGWLLDIETQNGHLSLTPAGGWAPPTPRPAFDQQPIEAAALADACARAHAVTDDPHWLAGLDLAVAWFHGHNDGRVRLYDPVTGGGYDALARDGVNINQGAESTLAMLATLQYEHARHPTTAS